MSLVIYNLGISLFNGLLAAAALFNDKARKLLEGRRQTWQKLQQFAAQKFEHVLWFHAASLGEFEQGRPIIEKLKAEDPQLRILLTFFSPSGYEVRKNYSEADAVVYLPADTAGNARKFIALVKPKAAVFIKYEFWYHYLKTCADHSVLTLSVSSIFRRDQPFFKPYGGLSRRMLRYFDHIFVQDQNSIDLLKPLRLRSISISGDARFDRVAAIAKQKKEVREAALFKGEEKMMVLGSTWSSDMEVLLPFFEVNKSKMKFIIAPHNIEEKDVLEVMKQLGGQAVRFSQASDDSLKAARYLIIDNMGILSSLYAYGEYAYVGGAFRQNLHNILEAAAHGVPVFFGDAAANIKFREAGELTNTGAGIPVKNAAELIEKTDLLHRDEDRRAELGALARAYVHNNTGAADIVSTYIQMAAE